MFLLNGILKRRLLLLLIFAVGFILRLYKWNGYGFWYDEAFWLIQSVEETIILRRPPLFRFLLFLWEFFGQGEFVLRLLPSILGALSILITYRVGKILFNEKIGLTAAFFMSLSPFHVYYSQELNYYTLVVALSLCSIYYLIRVLKENRICLWAKFVFFASLLIYTHYLLLFLLAAENIFFFSSFGKYKNLLKRWLLSQLTILILWFPYLIFLFIPPILLSVRYEYDWIPRGSLTHIFQLFRLFNMGYNANFIIHLFSSLLFFPLLITGIFFNLKSNKEEIKLLIIWLSIPMILSILFYKLFPTFTYRNFIFTLPTYYLLIANGITRLRKYLWVPFFCFAVLSGFSLFNYYRNIFPYPEDFYRPGVHAKKDNKGASEYIIRNFREGDIVVHTCLSTTSPYIYYFSVFSNKKGDKLRIFFLNLLSHPTDDNYLDSRWHTNFVINNEEEILKFTKGYRRLWLVLSHWEPHSLDLYPSTKENKIKQRLDTDLIMLEHKEFEGIKIYFYQID